jgi:hypothetical protein
MPRSDAKFGIGALACNDRRFILTGCVDVSFRDLIDQAMGKPAPRADLHISRSHDGELFLTSRQDGMIRMLVPDSAGGN